MRLSRDRNENVEGLTEPQQVELTLDGQRVQMFGVKPNRNQSGIYYADEAVDKDLKVRIHVSAGPHEVGVVSRGRRSRSRRLNASRVSRTSTWIGIRACRSRSTPCRSPVRSTPATVTDTPSRRRLFVCKTRPEPPRPRMPARSRSCRPSRGAHSGAQ